MLKSLILLIIMCISNGCVGPFCFDTKQLKDGEECIVNSPASSIIISVQGSDTDSPIFKK